MDLLVYGFGGFEYAVAEIAIENGYKNIEIFDDNEPQNLSIHNGVLNYLGKYDAALYAKVPLVIAIGNNQIRAKVAQKIKHKLSSIIHSSAIISSSATIEEGSIILQNVVIGANTIIKKNCSLNTLAVIDNDCELDYFIHVRPLAYIGSNSKISSFKVILPNIFVEKFSNI
tara:strand:+ start:1012 stop:1524 length:513 start_codon:yes stop_codon:yes gene_type:complete